MMRKFTEDGWMKSAKCLGSPEIFYPDPDPKGFKTDEDKAAIQDLEDEALQVCNGDRASGTEPCPVRKECLDYALTNREPDGIWGGMTTKQRKAYLKLGGAAL